MDFDIGLAEGSGQDTMNCETYRLYLPSDVAADPKIHAASTNVRNIAKVCGPGSFTDLSIGPSRILTPLSFSKPFSARSLFRFVYVQY